MRLHTCHTKQISNMPHYKLNWAQSNHSRLQAVGNLQHMAKDKSQHKPSKNQSVLEQNTLQTSALAHFFLPLALAMEEGRKEEEYFRKEVESKEEKRNEGEDLAKLERTN
ncbi:unnamed protein product, partial [Prunus brigantina]